MSESSSLGAAGADGIRDDASPSGPSTPGRRSASPAEFDEFVRRSGPRLRRVLVAHYGLDAGVDVTADALAWAWEHWDEVRIMRNPAGYLYRVGQSKARRYRRWRRAPVALPVEGSAGGPDGRDQHVEPGLEKALANLKAAERVAIVLVHALDFTYQEAADAMDVPVTTVRNHLHRGMMQLRREIGDGR